MNIPVKVYWVAKTFKPCLKNVILPNRYFKELDLTCYKVLCKCVCNYF